MDTETKKILSEGEMLRHLTESEGWFIVRQKWTEKIMDLQSILNVDTDKPENAIIDLKSRALAMKALMDWMKSIESDVERHVTNSKPVNDSFIRIYDGDKSSKEGTN